ncbi:3-dehydroquinate synthetase [Thermococcus onnurineus NA1]|uniref:3-dehydroquinate synthetase n=1 Tax=Thermococcus onnurineus (strain NA1) TaxID=523850 RepID=B6YX09_THEON|nr:MULTISPECIES: 3-dehydroquinate synthase family protein [Thermococcus]ACJ16622.1 3-dehydroquinate synthetase [Thermococcus onnurineus NA1]NJE47461.1 3-dehydroquinate synthase [Thermococcus sp. GR7]NJE78611.1 3-dehydroquinate synthase [Thermococcus sp. GR4]NJF23511.1 3-dehydroquinate synthase [Thermococcus sp. GR5]
MEGLIFGSLEELPSVVEKLRPHRVVILTNTTLERLWLGKVMELVGGEAIVIPDGEEHKRLETAVNVWNMLVDMGFTRRSLLVGLGGGVVTDLAGFIASTYMRGTMLGLVPTTLLAQVDAAIGGKTGVNFRGKNMIGTFYLPDFVLIAHETLSTLPGEEVLNGLGEVAKYAVLKGKIYGMVRKFPGMTPELVRECALFKAKVVEEDFMEAGKRRILNLGHTTAHAIEKLSDYRIKHGLAVAMGLMVAAKVGEHLYGFDAGKVEELLNAFGLPTRHPFEAGEIVREMRLDKKAWRGRLVFVVPEDIGKVHVEEVGEEVVKRALEETA